MSTPCEADGDLCTIDHCDGNGGCVTYDNMVCQDPNPPCEGGKYCEPTTGQCVDHPDADLSTPCEVETPPDLCTIDHCDGSGACVTYDNVVCQDANPPCEGGQHCEPTTGQCVDDPDADLSTPCEVETPPDLCTIDHCDGNGNCVWLSDVDCSHLDDQCNVGVCDPATGECEQDPKDLSTPCEADGDPCTGDHCDGNGQCVFDRYVCGACCLPDGSCQDDMTTSQCAVVPGGGSFRGAGSVCLGDADGNGIDDLCERLIPTVSEWGLLILALLLLTLGKVCFGRRQWAWGEQ